MATETFEPKTWLFILGAAALTVVPALVLGERKAFFGGLGNVDIKLGNSIGGGHYRITDQQAKKLMQDAGKKTLKHGYTMIVEANGQKMNLVRTRLSTDAYGKKAPKRGWVWAVY